MEERRFFGPTRGSLIGVFHALMKLVVIGMGTFLLAVFLGDEGGIKEGYKELANNGYFLLILVVNPIASIVRYISTTYEVTEKSFLVKSGILTKKVVELPLETISTVDFSQSLFYQIFQSYKVKIDNATQSALGSGKSEIVISLKKDDAHQLKTILTERHAKLSGHSENLENQMEEGNLITPGILDIALMGVFSTSFLMIFQIMVVGVPTIGVIITLFQKMLAKVVFQSADDFYEVIFNWFSADMVVRGFLVAVVIYLITMIYSVGRSLLLYYPFQVRLTAKEIKINYGILSKKQFTFHKRKVSGMKRKQTWLMRLMGYESVELLVIGYGDENKEDRIQEIPLFLPISKVKKSGALMGLLFPGCEEQTEIFQAPKKSLPYFFLAFRVFFSAGVLTGIYIAEGFLILKVLGWLFVAFMILSVFLEFAGTKMELGENYIFVHNGIFSTTCKMVPWTKVEAVITNGSIWKKKLGLTTFRINTNAPMKESNLLSKNMNIDLKKRIENKMMEN